MKPTQTSTRRSRTLRAIGIASIGAAGIIGAVVLHASSSPTPLAISQVPLQLASPIRPQVVIAVTNSQSMDGDMSGAIMTGSGFPGTPAANYASLLNSSSPSNYTVPAGFTAPVTGTLSGASAPYTVSTGGVLYDNSESRLNLAKATIQNIVSTYIQTTDFALVSYDPPSPELGNTWVYYMSPPGGFTFNNTGPAGTTTTGGVTSTTTVVNPCYQSSTSSSVKTYCSGISTSQYMVTAASSDDANINDVLYSNSYASSPFSVALDYGTVRANGVTITSGMTPYYNASSNPGGYHLSAFESGSVLVGYSSATCCISETGPTNAGYVPYTSQVMYALRGFGYSSGTTTAATSSSSSWGYVGMTNLGSTVTTSAENTAIATFATALAPETNSTSTNELKATSGQSPIGILINGANNAFAASGSSSDTNRPCATPKYIILVTDGQPTEDSSSNHYNWPPLGSDSAIALGVTANFDTSGTATNGALASSNDQAVIDAYNSVLALNTGATFTGGSSTIISNHPNLVGNTNSSYVYTYVIGLGDGANGTSPVQQGAQNVLNALAYAGGTRSYYPATNPAQVQAALSAIMLDIQSHTLATVASSANSTHLSTNTIEYQATFTSSEPTNLDWTGELYAEQLTISGAPTGTQSWSARALLTSQSASSRAIATWTPTATVTGAGAPFEIPGASGGGISVAQGTAITPTTAQFGSPLPASATMSNALQYLRGDSTNELAPIGSGAFRKRTWHLGDIINSQPTFVGPSVGPYTTDSSYLTFAANNASRTPMIYVGANDGMLHAFVAATGVEQFAFIPSGVFSKLTNLTVPSYNLAHQYFVDGSPQTADVKFTDSRGWTTMLLGGEGGGGRSIYALDVTNPTSNTEATATVTTPSPTNRPWVLWEYNGDGSDNNMGLSYSIPTVALTNVASGATGSSNGFVVFFGNGYNSPNQSAVLYALNPQTGTPLFAATGSGSTYKGGLDLCAAVTNICDPSLPNGLSSVTVGNSSGNPRQAITTIYAGDLQGNLWAIDVSNALMSNWVVRCLYNGTKYNSSATVAAQPITTAPVVTLAPNYPAQQGLMVIFATGELLAPADLTNTSTQTAYAIWDAPGDTANQPYTTAILEQQTLTYVSAATSSLPQPILTATSNTINWTTQRGWYVNLSASGLASGYRVLSDPVLFNSGFEFVMNVPPVANSCGGTWTSFFLDLNYATGGNFSTPHLDINGDGYINSSDYYTSGSVTTAPVGTGLGSGFASGINNFGLSGLSVVTIASSADATSLSAAITATSGAGGAIPDLIVASNNLTSTADIAAALTATQAAYNAILAAYNTNPGSYQLAEALADATLALAAAQNASTEINAGGAPNISLATPNLATSIQEMQAAGSLLTSNLSHQVDIPLLRPMQSNNPWWQVL